MGLVALKGKGEVKLDIIIKGIGGLCRDMYTGI